MKFKLSIIFITIFLAGVGIYKLSRTKQLVNNNKETLVIGTAAGYAPFVSLNEQGDYEGFDIDIAKEVAAKTNKKLILKDLGSMTSLILALEQGSIDAIIWSMSITKDRLKKFAMIRYQGTDTKSYPLIFWQKIPVGIKNINDMTGLTICVEPNSSQGSVLAKYKHINILPTEKVDDALLNIQYGKANAALLEPAIAKKFKNKFPEIQILDIALDQEDQVYGIGIVLKLDNTNLINEIQIAVDKLKKNGFISNAEKKWGIE